MDILWITVQGLLLSARQWLTIASADAVILSASNFGVTAAEDRDCSPGSRWRLQSGCFLLGNWHGDDDLGNDLYDLYWLYGDDDLYVRY